MLLGGSRSLAENLGFDLYQPVLEFAAHSLVERNRNRLRCDGTACPADFGFHESRPIGPWNRIAHGADSLAPADPPVGGDHLQTAGGILHVNGVSALQE